MKPENQTHNLEKNKDEMSRVLQNKMSIQSCKKASNGYIENNKTEWESSL